MLTVFILFFIVTLFVVYFIGYCKSGPIGALVFTGLAAYIIIASIFFCAEHFGCDSSSRKSSENSTVTYSSNTQSDHGDTTDAWIYTKEIVRRELKSPGTAKFEFAGHRGVNYLGNKRYSFSSYVDSQNSFGAMIRTHFHGTIKETHNRWVMEELNYN